MGDNIEDFLDGLPQDQANAFLDLALRSQILCTSIYGDQIVQTTTIGNQTVETTFINPKDPKAEKADSVYSLPEGYSLNGDRFAVPDGFHVVELNKMDNFKDVQSQFPGLTISKDGKIRDDVTGLQMCVIKNDVTGEISFVTAGMDGPHTLAGNDGDDIGATYSGSGVSNQYPEFKAIVDAVIINNPDSVYSFTGHSLGAVMSELYIAELVQRQFVEAIKERFGEDVFNEALAKLNDSNVQQNGCKNEFVAALTVAKDNGYPKDLPIDMSKFSGLLFENYGTKNSFWQLMEQENNFTSITEYPTQRGGEIEKPYKNYIDDLIETHTNIFSLQSDGLDPMGNSVLAGGRFSEVISLHKDFAPEFDPIAQHAVFTFYSELEECSEGLSVVASVEGTVEGHAKAEASRTGRR